MTFIAPETYSKILKTMPVLCVDVMILRDGKCLLLLRDNEPAKNQYWFPGGRIHKNELIEAAALRKAKEETNLDCVFDKIVSIEQTIFERAQGMSTDVHTVNICCTVNVPDYSTLKIDALHKGVLWTDKLFEGLHSGVMNPLKKIGFSF